MTKRIPPRRAWSRVYYQRNRERVLARAQQYRDANRALIRQQGRECYQRRKLRSWWRI
jgi:hypothetical protein